MSRPANRTALRRRRTGPRRRASRLGPARCRADAVDRLAERPGAAQLPGRPDQLPAQGVQLAASQLHHPQAQPCLLLPGRRQVLAGQLGGSASTSARDSLRRPGRPGGTGPRARAAPRRCARAAGRDRSPAAPGTPARAPAGSSTPAAGPGPAGHAAAAHRPGRSWRASSCRAASRYRRARPGAPRCPPPPAPRPHTASRCTPPPRTPPALDSRTGRPATAGTPPGPPGRCDRTTPPR